jgi:radical SAM protein with 4Fe4S-binding SPASM domain
MLMQTPAYSFGSVNPEAAEPKQQSPFHILAEPPGSGKDTIEAMIENADKYKNTACGRCWAQPLCHGCQGEDFERVGAIVNRSEIPGISEFCDYKRALVERFLRALARVQVM